MGARIGNVYHRAVLSSINNRRAGGGTDNPQADADGEILCVGSGGDDDRIARGRKRDGVPDGLASGLGCLAVVAVVSVHPIHVPCVTG